MIHRTPDHRRRAQHRARGRRQPLHPQQQRLPQRSRQLTTTDSGAREQLLREERIALTADKNPVDHAGAWRTTRDRLQLLRHLRALQRLQLHPLRAPRPLQLRNERPQRMSAMQLVGPVGDNHRDPVVPRVTNQQRKQITGGRIDPVHILDNQQHRLLPRQPGEHPIHRLKQLLPPRVHTHNRTGDRPQRPQRRAHRPLKPLQHPAVLDHPTQRRDDRRKRQLTFRQLHTLTHQNKRFTPTSPHLYLRNEPTLPDPRLTGDQNRRTHPRRSTRQRALQNIELRYPPDKPRR